MTVPVDKDVRDYLTGGPMIKKNRPLEEAWTVRYPSSTSDKVNHPSHYKGSKFEAIDVIEDFDLDFCLGNAVKYILRAGKKHENINEDIKKAIWYLNRKLGDV